MRQRKGALISIVVSMAVLMGLAVVMMGSAETFLSATEGKATGSVCYGSLSVRANVMETVIGKTNETHFSKPDCNWLYSTGNCIKGWAFGDAIETLNATERAVYEALREGTSAAFPKLCKETPVTCAGSSYEAGACIYRRASQAFHYLHGGTTYYGYAAGWGIPLFKISVVLSNEGPEMPLPGRCTNWFAYWDAETERIDVPGTEGQWKTDKYTIMTNDGLIATAWYHQFEDRCYVKTNYMDEQVMTLAMLAKCSVLEEGPVSEDCKCFVKQELGSTGAQGLPNSYYDYTEKTDTGSSILRHVTLSWGGEGFSNDYRGCGYSHPVSAYFAPFLFDKDNIRWNRGFPKTIKVGEPEVLYTQLFIDTAETMAIMDLSSVPTYDIEEY
ncbi:MAG: hypothetical protein CL963_01360 [Euryarchaeota archaeon]|nr:hypothetical protein [Euryarchaeota archaeon]